MIKIYDELKKRNCYISEFSNENELNESLNIKKENVFITFKYEDESIIKVTKMKLLVFQNENTFNSYENWISKKIINGEKALKKFRFFAQKNEASNTFFLLLIPKTECFMEKYNNLIIEKNNKISKLLKRYRSQYLFY